MSKDECKLNMTKKEHVDKVLLNKIQKFNLPETLETILRSESKNQYEYVTYNNFTEDIVDPLAEFYLCKKYFIYFIETYGYILDVKNKRVYGITLYNFQRNIMVPAFLNERYIIFRKSRQIGASVVSGLYALWVINFNVAQEVVIISKTRKDAQDFKTKAMVTYEKMPMFLKTKPTLDGQNMTTLKLVNKSKIEVRAQSEDAGRGFTAALVIMDEAAFMPYADDIWGSAYPSVMDSNGQCIVISTSNGVGNWYHQTWLSAEESENDFYPIYIPWWMFPNRGNPWLENIENKDVVFLEAELGEEKIKEIRKIRTKRFVNGHLVEYFDLLVEEFISKKEEEQLNYKGPKEKKPWLKRQRDQLKVRKFNQEILSRFLGSGNTVINYKILEAMEEELKEPIQVDQLYDGHSIQGLQIFEEPIEELGYTLFSDVATGAGTDYSTFSIFRDDTLEQVAEYKAQLDTKKFGKIIKDVAKYFNYSYVVIETNQGLSVFNEVFLDEKDPYENCYYEFKNKAYRGFHTGPAEKRLMIDEFITDIEDKVIKVYAKRTLGELKVFIWHNKKPQASPGYNDDLIIPLMILAYVLRYGNRHTESLGFASSKHGIVDIKKDIEEEGKALKEIAAKEFVKEIYDLSWEDYTWVIKD